MNADHGAEQVYPLRIGFATHESLFGHRLCFTVTSTVRHMGRVDVVQSILECERG